MIIAPLVAQFEKYGSILPVIPALYALPYRRVLDREINLAGITHKDKVLNIGCGGIPYSAIYIARKTGARVHAVDIDEQAVVCAQRCIASQGLSHLITLEHSPGEHTRCTDFTAALVALQARPKQAILEHLLAQGASGRRVIMRRAQPHLHGEYDPLPELYSFQGEVMQHMKTFISSVLYHERAVESGGYPA